MVKGVWFWLRVSGKGGYRIIGKVVWSGLFDVTGQGFCRKEKAVLLVMVNFRKCCNRCKRRRADDFFEADAEICTVCVSELAPRKNCSTCRRNRRV